MINIFRGIILLFCFIILFNSEDAKSQSDQRNLGIKISKVEFEEYINEYTKVDSVYIFELDDYIRMVRMVNTISKKMIVCDLCYSFNQIFYEKYADYIIIKLNLILHKGGALYSREHNLFLGGKPHENSQFFVSDI